MSVRVRPEDVVTRPGARSRFEADGAWNDETLPGLVARHAATSDRVAVVDSGGRRSITYGELDRTSNRVANALLCWGVEPGDVVSVQLPNWYETVAIDLGILKAGAILNPLLPIYRASELRHVLEVVSVPVFFVPGVYRGFDHGQLAAELRDELPELRRVLRVAGPDGGDDDFRELLEGFSDEAPSLKRDAAAPSELIFTSGTEATPKAVLHSEQTTGFSARAAAAALGMNGEDVVWMPSPIGHSTGFNYGVRIALHHGLTLVLQDRWDGAEAADLVERFHCSYCVAATTFLSDLVATSRAGNRDLSSLRLFGCGGAPIPAEVVEAAEESGLAVLRLYGSTEVLVATWNRPQSPVEKRRSSDGCPLPGVEVEIRDDDGNAVIGAPGEIVVRGPNTCLGFFDDAERTGRTFEADGWVRSGDLGVIDEDGYLSVIGRKKEIIIRGGLNIAPSEVESVIRRHPQIADVAVIGIADRRLGERTCACVVTAPSNEMALEQLVEFLKVEGMATFKLPQLLVAVAELPKTPTGKVQKHLLVEMVERRPEPS